MKKLLLICLTMAILFNMTGCSRSNNNTNTVSNNSSYVTNNNTISNHSSLEEEQSESFLSVFDEALPEETFSTHDHTENTSELEELPSEDAITKTEIPNISAYELLSWVKNPTTIEELQQLGYEIDLEFSSPRFNLYAWYRIKGTSVRLNTIVGNTDINSITVSAKIAIPDYIGQPGDKFYIDNVLVLHSDPDGIDSSTVILGSWGTTEIIEADSDILLVSKESFDTALQKAGYVLSFEDVFGSEPTPNETYSFTVTDNSYYIYDNPSFNSNYIDILPIGTYTIIEKQYDEDNNLWGKLKSGLGWICLEIAPCEEPNDGQYGFCSHCGVEISDQNFAFEGFGLCSDCYYATLDPEYICNSCGRDCSFIGTIDGLCEFCYEAQNPSIYSYCINCGVSSVELYENGLCEYCYAGMCFLCGGPLGDSHDCDDYPNVICPNCNWGMFTTGVGVDGVVCPICNTRII